MDSTLKISNCKITYVYTGMRMCKIKLAYSFIYISSLDVSKIIIYEKCIKVLPKQMNSKQLSGKLPHTSIIGIYLY